MTEAEFRQHVENGIKALPEWVQRDLTNVVFLVEDEPTARQRTENGLEDEETLFGLYEGVPLSERGNESPLLPDVITIFRKPILEAYEREEDIQACIHNTVWHEVAHYFGHDEEWVAKEEIRRGRIV
jgi:predicted Zn-dependent protease with MMP-like domain